MKMRKRRLVRFWLAAFFGVLGGVAIGLILALPFFDWHEQPALAEPECDETMYQAALAMEAVEADLTECTFDKAYSFVRGMRRGCVMGQDDQPDDEGVTGIEWCERMETTHDLFDMEQEDRGDE